MLHSRMCSNLRSILGAIMTEFLLDECYSCVIASLVLIKSVAMKMNDDSARLIAKAADLSQTCIDCIRSHEAGSVLPATLERLANESQALLDCIKISSLETPELTASSIACDNFLRTYQQAV